MTKKKKRWWAPKQGPVLPWRVGQIAQGLIMGVLLAFAAVGLAAMYGNVSAFQYQGF
jgi:hypothetical protein